MSGDGSLSKISTELAFNWLFPRTPQTDVIRDREKEERKVCSG